MKGGWAASAMGEVAEINPKADRPADDTPVSFVPMTALNADVGQTLAAETRRFSAVAKGYSKFRRDDLLVAKITPCFENGKIGRAAIQHELGAGSTEFHVVRPDTAKLDPSYALHFLRLARVRRAGELRMTGSAGQRRVPEQFLAALSIPLPPLDEQRRIARVLDMCESLRRKRRATVEASDGLVQALFAEAFAEHRDSASLPLSDLVVADRPVTYGILKPGPDVPDGVPYVRVVDIANGEIRAQSTRRTSPQIAAAYRRSTLAPGDLVMSIRGHVGRLAVVPPELKGGNITQDSARLAICDYDARYVVEAIRSAPVQAWMRRRIKGVAVQGINLADVKMIPIPQVSILAQREFSTRAAGCDRVLARGRAQLRHLDALFASLEHRAFTGAL